MLPGQFDRSLPQRFRQLLPPRLGASKLIQLALQLRDWFGNGCVLMRFMINRTSAAE